MKLKTQSIIKAVDTHGKVIIKLDPQSGFRQLTINKRRNAYLVGEHPGGRIYKANQSELAAQLDEIAMFINSWA